MQFLALFALLPLPAILQLVYRFLSNRTAYRKPHWYIVASELLNMIILPLLYFMVIGITGNTIFIAYLCFILTGITYFYSRYHTQLKKVYIYILLNLALLVWILVFTGISTIFYSPKDIESWFIILNFFVTILCLLMAVMENMRLIRMRYRDLETES